MEKNGFLFLLICSLCSLGTLHTTEKRCLHQTKPPLFRTKNRRRGCTVSRTSYTSPSWRLGPRTNSSPTSRSTQGTRDTNRRGRGEMPWGRRNRQRHTRYMGACRGSGATLATLASSSSAGFAQMPSCLGRGASCSFVVCVLSSQKKYMILTASFWSCIFLKPYFPKLWLKHLARLSIKSHE